MPATWVNLKYCVWSCSYGAPKGTSVDKNVCYFVPSKSFRSNEICYFVPSRYHSPSWMHWDWVGTISFPRNHFVRTKYVISFPRNVIRHHEIYHIIIYYHIYYHIYIYLIYISYISHIYISYIYLIYYIIYISYIFIYIHIFFFISFIYTGTLHSAIGRFSMSSTFHILHWLHICQIHGDK